MADPLHRRALFAAAAVALVGVGITLGWGALAGDGPHHVKLVVDYDDGVQKTFKALAWSKGMTVIDAMDLAKAHPRGITYDAAGKGPTAFVLSIDGLNNEGGGKRNWQYWVNTDFADKSAGAWALEPGDVVLWRFTQWKGKQEKAE